MISVLIPVFNYDVTSLVNAVHAQLTASNIAFEIICLDDNSEKAISDKNKVIATLSNVKYLPSDINNGIAITRQKLVKNAAFDWVILLDADTRINNTFISNYLEQINAGYDFIFGGFDYENSPPTKDSLLRWKYGKKCEAILAEVRNENPYKVTIAANLLAKKEVYLNLGLDAIGNNYAMDYYFGSLLKSTKAKVLHINNQVIHLGIENSHSYLRKKEKAVNTLLRLYKQGELKQHANDLLKAFVFLKSIGLNYILAFLFKTFNTSMQKNLVGTNPWITLLQCYKLSYMCYADLKGS